MTDAPIPSHQTHATGRDRFRGHLAMFTFAALIAGSFSFGRLALPYVDPAPLNAVRYIIAALAMGIYAFGMRGHRFQRPVAPWRFAILGALMGFYFVAMFVALTMTSPVSTSAVFTLMPLLTAFFGYLILQQVVRPLVGVSLIFAGVGSVWVIFGGDLNAILAFDIGRGEVIYFVGCIGHAMFAPLLRKFDRGEPSSVSTFFILIATGLWISLYGAPGIMATNWLALPPVAWMAVFYLAIFSGMFTFLIMQFAAQRMPASKMLAYGYLVPVFVIFYEGLMGNGWVSLTVALGAFVTCLGLVVLYFARDA